MLGAGSSDFGSYLLDTLVGEGVAEHFELRSARGPWVHCSPVDSPDPPETWKLHVSAYAWSAPRVLQAIVGVLVTERIPFKIAADMDVLIRLNSGSLGADQIGKFATIYPASEEQSSRLGLRLHSATTCLGGPEIAKEQRIAPTSIVYRRYGNAKTPSEPHRTICGRYIVIQWMRRSSGHLGVALDTATGKSVLVKAARVGEERAPEYPAIDALCVEAVNLRALEELRIVPNVLEHSRTAEFAFLVMQDVRADPLAVLVGNTEFAHDGKSLLELARQMAAAVEQIHARGMAHGDLSPTNVLVGEDGRVSIVDFETARAFGTPDKLLVGTAGYFSPTRTKGLPILPEHDVYSLGSLLYFAATERHPGAGAPYDLLLRNPAAGVGVAATVAAAMSATWDHRPRTVADFRTWVSNPPKEGPALNAPSLHQLVQFERERLAQATEVALSPSRVSPLTRVDLGIGWGGAVAVLARLDSDPTRIERLALALLKIPGNPTENGFFVGDASRSVALSFAFLMQPNERLLIGMRRLLLEQPRLLTDNENPDVFAGVAGYLRACVLAWRVTRESEFLDRAVACGSWLLRQMTELGVPDSLVSIPSWEIPSGHGSLSGRREIGYAHGAAGIGDALLDLFDECEDPRLRAVVLATGAGLVACAEVDESRQTAKWPRFPGERTVASHWCHGAGGIARFLARTSRRFGMSEFMDLAILGAASEVAFAWRSEMGQCHGVAGAIQTLSEVHADNLAGIQKELGRLTTLVAAMLASDSPVSLTASCWSFLEGRAGALAALTCSSNLYTPTLECLDSEPASAVVTRA